ncbi:hypothetical protein [Aquimarina rhabdastrellae]
MRKSLFFLIAISLFFNSCTKESEVSEPIKIEAKDYGKIHNEAVKAYLYSPQKDKNFDGAISDMLEVISEEMEVKYPGVFKKEKFDIEAFYKTNTKSQFDETALETIPLLFQEAIADGRISNRVGELLSDIYTSNYTQEQTLEILNQFKSNDLSTEEEEAVIIFESTAIASYELWNAYYEEEIAKGNKSCRPTQQIIIADAATTVLGTLLAGPFGGLAGAAASLIVEQGTSSRGGCI